MTAPDIREGAVALPYGRDTLRVALPPGVEADVLGKGAMPVLPDPRQAVAAALARPLGAPSLGELARGAASACIVICDITRPVPNGLFLMPLVEALEEAGVPRRGISVVVATGLHRPNLDDELREVVGDPRVLDAVRVENHDAGDDEAHVRVGRTRRGTEVRLDRRFVEADVRIVTGLVEPHFMAGYSGGRKVIAPGIAHRETITTFHSHRFMADPKATNCVLEGNPLHEDQLEIVSMLEAKGRPVLALNTVIDEERRLAFVSFGACVASHLEAVAFVRRHAEVPVGRRYRTLVTSGGGYPLDQTYYQTVKGMVAPIDILEPGGDLIIASRCAEGLGSPAYREAQARLLALGREAFLSRIASQSHARIDEWQTQMQLRATGRVRVLLHADGLGEEEGRLTGVERVDDLARAIAESTARQGADLIAVIPEGPYVVPRYAGPEPPVAA